MLIANTPIEHRSARSLQVSESRANNRLLSPYPVFGLPGDQCATAAYLPALTQSQSPPSEILSGFFTTKSSTVSGAKHSR